MGSISQLFFPDIREFCCFVIITKNTAILPISLMHHTRFSKSLDTVQFTCQKDRLGSQCRWEWSWESVWDTRQGTRQSRGAELGMTSVSSNTAGSWASELKLGLSTGPVLSCTRVLETTASLGSMISGENLAAPPKTVFRNIPMVYVSCKGDE